jgi:hypothetical protein
MHLSTARLQSSGFVRFQTPRTTIPSPTPGTATLNGGETYALTVSLDDTYYTVIFTRKWKWSFSPSGLAPGDKISVRIEGDKLFMKHAKDKEMKGTIVTTRRLGPE